MIPERQIESRGHNADHAALKADYDLRHPDAPLPSLADDSHIKIHNLLAADYNSRIHLEHEDVPRAVAGNSGHVSAHNILAEACNARNELGRNMFEIFERMELD